MQQSSDITAGYYACLALRANNLFIERLGEACEIASPEIQEEIRELAQYALIIENRIQKLVERVKGDVVV